MGKWGEGGGGGGEGVEGFLKIVKVTLCALQTFLAYSFSHQRPTKGSNGLTN